MDLRLILNEWEFDPENTLRVIDVGASRKVLQVRLPLGIEQYELEGRPDGKRPQGFSSYLDHVESKLADFKAELHTDRGFAIEPQEMMNLQNEGMLFYYRYLLLFQLNDFEGVIRDTEHNLRLCLMVGTYAEHEEDKLSILQFRPYIIRMNAVARSMLFVNSQSWSKAVAVLDNAIKSIEDLDNLASAVFQFERSRSLTHLRTALEQLKGKEANPLEELNEELKKALDDENYERAADLRDKIRSMT